MVKVAAYHSSDASGPDVHHDHDNCPAGRQVPSSDRVPGTGGRPLCQHCRDLGLSSPTSSG